MGCICGVTGVSCYQSKQISIHCNKIPVKLTVKLPAAVLPTKNRKIYGNDNDNRYFLREKTRKLYGQDGDNRKKITVKTRKNYGQYDNNRKRLWGETVNLRSI